MTLPDWILLWKIVLVGGVGLFVVLAVVVTIGGLFDVRQLFQMLRDRQDVDGGDVESRGGP